MRRTIRQAKRESWKKFCSKIGRTTPVGDVWSMIRKMKEWDYPVLENDGELAVTDKDKAEMLVKAFVQIHGSGNLSEEGRRRREITKRRHLEDLERSGEMEDQQINFPFTMEEMKRAIYYSNNTNSAPGKDQIRSGM